MEHYRLLIRNYYQDHLGIGNVLKCLISGLSINDDTVIECYPHYMYGAYDTILDKKFIYDPATSNQKETVPINTCRILLLYYEDAYQNDLPNEEITLDPLHPKLFHWYFSRTKRIDWHYDPALVDSRVRERILGDIRKIVFLPIIHESVEKWTRLFCHAPSLGVSIRTWTASHEGTVGRPYSTEVYFKRINQVMTEHPEIQTIVLSVDNPAVIGEYLTEISAKYPHCAFIVLQKPAELNAIQYAVTKALTLARSTYFIGNRMSTFSELVYWFGECKPVVYTVF
jgi:hypothetical protein